jgi:hypothetical protein
MFFKFQATIILLGIPTKLTCRHEAQRNSGRVQRSVIVPKDSVYLWQVIIGQLFTLGRENFRPAPA